MTGRSVMRALALVMCLALLGTALPAVAETEAAVDEAVSFETVDPEVPAGDEIVMAPEAEPQAADPAAPALETEPAPETQPAPETEPAPAVDAEAVPAASETPAEPETQAADPAAPEGETQAVLAPEGEPSGEPAPAEPEAPAEEVSRDVPGWETRVVDRTLAVDTEVWNTVNLVRAGGFDGKLATVSGILTLNNALIEGEAVDVRALTDYFELEPYGAIVLNNGGRLTLSAAALSINRGDSRTFTLRWNGRKVAGNKARWCTTDKSVVRVSKSGKIVAMGPGTALIGAKYKKTWVLCQVVVTDYNFVKSVKLPKKMTLAMNAATNLTAVVYPADAVNAAVTWSSSNSAVASVDENGLVTGLSGGAAYIYASTCYGIYARCKVTVREIKPSSIGFSKAFITLNPGDTAATEVGMSPAIVSNPRVLYASSNPAVAEIDENGVIRAVGVGRATITATAAANSRARSSCTVFVVEPGSGRLAGLVIGINPGHQTRTIKKKYPLAPGSKKKAYGCKVGAGGRWTHIPEYEVVLQIGLKLQKLLTDAGATVVMTRTTNDVYLTNIQRAQILNQAGVDVALQLHCNSNKNKSHHGCSGFVRTTGGWYYQSRAIARSLVNHICAQTGMTNKGVKKYNGYMSLNWTTTPSVLLEMGHLSNRTEDYLLSTDEFRQQIAQGIFDGLCEYFGR